MLIKSNEDTDQSISKPLLFNSIPIIESDYHISLNLFQNTPNKNITVYSKNFIEKFECNLFLAKAAFSNYFEKNIENLLSSQINEKILEKSFSNTSELDYIRNLIKKRNELLFEKLSFENSTQESFFLLQYPNADRSQQRKNNVLDGIKSISAAITEKTANLNINILYVQSLNPRNIDNVRKFLCNMKDIQLNKPPPSPIDTTFYENLNKNNFYINIHNKLFQSKTVCVNPIAGFSFSNKIADAPSDYLNIEINSNVEIVANLLNDLISFKKVTLKYVNYPIYKEISELFDSRYLKKCIECFKKNIENLNIIFEKVNTLIEIQKNLFSINERNFEEINAFCEFLIQKPHFKSEIAHQITNASRFNPKSQQLYSRLVKNIEKYVIKNDFHPKIWEFSFSLIEKVLINDDLEAFQNLISTDSQIDINKSLIYCSCLSKKIKLIKIACFYGAIECFKFLISQDVEFDESKLLQFAIAGGNIEIIHLLNITEKKSIPKARQIAALYHRNTILDWLIENEIDKSNYIEKASESNNFYAAQIYFNQTFDGFIEKNDLKSDLNFNFFNQKIEKALEKALRYNHESFFCFLLNFPNVDASDINGKLLNTAIKSANMKSIDLVLSFRDLIFKYNSIQKNQDTLLTAIQTGSIEIVDKIYNLKEIRHSIERKIDQYKEFANDIILTGNKDIIQKFINFGNIFRPPLAIENIISQFVFFNDIKSIENIVDKNYFMIRKDWSPFPKANTIEMVCYLIECKSDINYCDEEGNTCLFNAIKNNNFEIIQLLLMNNATVRKSDYDAASNEIKKILDPYYTE